MIKQKGSGWALGLQAAGLAVALAFASACSSDEGDSGGSGDAGAGGDPGESGRGGTSGSSGRGGTSGNAGRGGRPPIPDAPPLRSCSALAPVYAGAACTSACTSVRCDCDPFPASYLGCHPTRGCLLSVDCSVACELDLEDVIDCIGDYAPCEADADCNGGRCLRQGDQGDCTS
ncbi:MAG TPA: hypothetical protein VGK73_29440, partial [Polyangiaceae bacterium]